MQREIKFRAWDKTRHEYLSGGQVLIAIEKGNHPKHNPVYLDILKDADFYKDRFILEQYTGLHDKNGKEIYEGDILEFYDIHGEVKFGLHSDNVYNGWYVDVKTAETQCELNESFYFSEIIGNIYEKPELLEVSE